MKYLKRSVFPLLRRSFAETRGILSILLTGLLVWQPLVTQRAYAQTPQPVQTIGCTAGFDVAVIPAPIFPLKSLKTVPNPVLPNGAAGAPRADIAQFVANQTVAIQLGKALFWDMQAGSDNKTACATCHFQAGADIRTKNQLHPGFSGSFPTGPNANLAAADFPFTTPDADKTDNSAGSQGVSAATFSFVDQTTGTENTSTVDDPVFHSFRRTTGLNAPSTINAVFNHRNFFNARAQADFNGVNPFGARDINAQVYVVNNLGQITPQTIRLDIASLASQAVGPPTNPVEMSASGRTFFDIGRKMLALKPLKLQTVDSRDSVLGRLADPKGKGLKIPTSSYPALIQAAFQKQYWDSPFLVTGPGGQAYTLTEANFSLFWGISIMLYEATLVSDDSPMDQFLDTRLFDAAGFLKKEGSTAKLSAVAKRLATDYNYPGGVTGILNGLRLFEKPLIPAPPPNGRECIACHLGANTTSASVANLVQGGAEAGDVALKGAGFDLRMERMFMQIPGVPTDLIGAASGKPTFFTDQITFDPNVYAVNSTTRVDVTYPLGTQNKTALAPPLPAPIATYDAGWYNVGARPPTEDPGVGGTDGIPSLNSPNGSPLSWVQYLPLTADPTSFKIPGGTLGCAAPTYDPGPTPPILRDALGVPLFPNVLLNAQGFPLLSGPLKTGETNDALGSFKTSSLRNVELNGPYFHNGSKATLMQVIDFYNNGGDFPKAADGRNSEFPTDRRSPLMKFYEFLKNHPPMGLTTQEKNDLVAFLISLTDDRVRLEKAPFDRPEIVIPAGDNDAAITLPAVGAAGRATPLKPFLSPLSPFTP